VLSSVKRSSATGVIVGCVIGGLVLTVVVVVGVVLYTRLLSREKTTKTATDTPGDHLQQYASVKDLPRNNAPYIDADAVQQLAAAKANTQDYVDVNLKPPYGGDMSLAPTIVDEHHYGGVTDLPTLYVSSVDNDELQDLNLGRCAMRHCLRMKSMGTSSLQDRKASEAFHLTWLSASMSTTLTSMTTNNTTTQSNLSLHSTMLTTSETTLPTRAAWSRRDEHRWGIITVASIITVWSRACRAM
jgi:hypothetical protein